MRATIIGLPFTWPARCWSCRKTTELTSPGTILIDLSASASRKTCRWTYRTRCPRVPELPAACPECGTVGGFRPGGDWRFLVQNKNNTHPGWPYPGPRHDPRMFPLQQQAYDTLRAAYPADAAVADAALQAQAQRTSALRRR
jgi:hypothetical protein